MAALAVVPETPQPVKFAAGPQSIGALGFVRLPNYCLQLGIANSAVHDEKYGPTERSVQLHLHCSSVQCGGAR